MENPTHCILERWTLCFSSYKSCELKVKVWWVGAREKETRVRLLYRSICPKEMFGLFSLCDLMHQYHRNLLCHILWKFLSNKMFLNTFSASNASGTKISLVKSFISFHFCQLIHHSHCHIYIYIYIWLCDSVSLSLYII